MERDPISQFHIVNETTTLDFCDDVRLYWLTQEQLAVPSQNRFILNMQHPILKSQDLSPRDATFVHQVSDLLVRRSAWIDQRVRCCAHTRERIEHM